MKRAGILGISGAIAVVCANACLQAEAPFLAPPDMKLCTVDESAISMPAAGRLPRGTFYFYKPIPGTDWIVYSDNQHTVQPHNYMYNLQTGQEALLTGNTEAMPLDRDHVSTGERKLRVYDTWDHLKAKLTPDEAFREDQLTPEQAKRYSKIQPVMFNYMLTDSYQSFGVLPREEVMRLYGKVPNIENSVVYRGLTGRETRLKVWDFRRYVGEDGQEKWEGLMDEAKLLCPKYSRQLSLPMISKNGLYFSSTMANLSDADDMDQRTNQAIANIVPAGPSGVFKINMPSGDCERVLNLGFMTEKIDFNYQDDAPAIAFTSVSNGKPPRSRVDPQNPGAWENLSWKVYTHATYKNAYVYQIKENRLIQLTHNTLERPLYSYPAFMQDGKVLVKMTWLRSDGTMRLMKNPPDVQEGFIMVDISNPKCVDAKMEGKSALAERAVKTDDPCADEVRRIMKDRGEFGKSPITEGLNEEKMLEFCYNHAPRAVEPEDAGK